MGCSASMAADKVAEKNLQLHLEILFDAYGKPTEQVGYTDGHYCLTSGDKQEAHAAGASLLYGEILASGITKLLDMQHLQAAKAQVLFDLGMGVGKLLLQAFLQYPNLKYVCGVEFATSRYEIAEQALLRLVSLQPDLYVLDHQVPGHIIRAHAVAGRRRRVIEMRRGDMWRVRDIRNADIVVMHTDFTKSCAPFFQRTVSEMKKGVRFVTYQDVTRFWPTADPPFHQLVDNLDEADAFATSWSAERGHHLFCWVKVVSTPIVVVGRASCAEESKEAMVDEGLPF